MHKKLGITLVLAISVAAAAIMVAGRRVPVVHAQVKGCDATSLSGAYGYLLSGYVYDNAGYSYYLGAVGRLSSDGAGNLTGADTYSFDGTIVKRQYTGTYTMNEDCTGSLTFATSNGNITHADLVTVNTGKEVNLVQTDGGFILTGTLKQQTLASQQPTQ